MDAQLPGDLGEGLSPRLGRVAPPLAGNPRETLLSFVPCTTSCLESRSRRWRYPLNRGKFRHRIPSTVNGKMRPTSALLAEGRISRNPTRWQRMLSLGMVLVFASSSPALGQSQYCLPAESDSAQLVQRIKWLLSDSSEASTLSRASLGITNVDPATVTVVTDSTVCTPGTNAITARFQLTPPTLAQYVFVVVGPRYFAYDPGSSGATLVFVLDETLQIIKSIFGF